MSTRDVPQRWNPGTKAYEPSCVYNLQTGEVAYRWPVDCAEMVKTGGWAYQLPDGWKTTVPDASSEEPAAREEVGAVPEAPAPLRRGPGRPRKAAVAED